MSSRKPKYFINFFNSPHILETLQNSYNSTKSISLKLSYFEMIKGFNDGKIPIEVSKAVYDRYIKNLKLHKGMNILISSSSLKNAFKNGSIPFKDQKQITHSSNEDKLAHNKTLFVNDDTQTGGFISSVVPVINLINKSIALYKGAKEVHHTMQALEKMLNRPKIKKYISKYERNEILDKFNEEEKDFEQIGSGLIPLSNQQINYSLKSSKSFKAALPRDVFLKYPIHPNESFVINLDLSGQSGSHWVAVKKSNNNVFYFDSFGTPPIDEVITRYGQHSDFYWNDKIIQDPHSPSPSCGYLCISFLKFLDKHNNNYEDFLNIFK